MLVVGIETSGRVGSVAVGRDGTVLAKHVFEPPRGHGGLLLSQVETVLEHAGIAVAEIDVFAANAGPGSFTGLRVGLATVASLAWALGKRATAFGSMDVLAHGWLTEADDAEYCATVSDARKSEVYGALFRRTGAGVECVIAPTAQSAESFQADVARFEKGNGIVTWIGTGVAAYPDAFGPARFESRSRASVLVTLATAAAKAGDLPPATPRYVRASSAEVKFGAAPEHNPLEHLIR
jgi:tRNA threonylcarbamoyladenosine biosynthesis protein TsaB